MLESSVNVILGLKEPAFCTGYDVLNYVVALLDMMSGSYYGDWFVQKFGNIVICSLAKSFSVSTVEGSGYGGTLKYGDTTLRIELPITPVRQPAIAANLGNRTGFIASCNFDSVTNELVLSFALMNFSAPDLYVRAIVVAEVAQ